MAHSKFFHYFPIPSFLRMQAVGLSIDDSSIRFVEIVEADGVISVSKHGTIDLPAQSIIEGEIINAEALKTALVPLRTKYSTHFSRIALPDDKTYVFKLRLPFIPEKEIRSALEFKIDENIPLSASEAIFDYVVVGQNDSLNVDVVVSAVARNTAESYNQLFKETGLQPLRFGLESQAVANAIVPKAEIGTIIIINFFPHKTSISVVENNIVQFNLTRRNDELGQVKKETLDSATHINAGETPKPVRDLQLIKHEFEQVLNYWHNKSVSNVEMQFKVIACGADVLAADFVESFSNIIGTPVLVANPWCNVFSDQAEVPPISKEESYKYAAAIGLALGQSINSNSNV